MEMIEFPWKKEEQWMKFEERLREEPTFRASPFQDEIIRRVRTAFDAAWMDDFQVSFSVPSPEYRDVLQSACNKVAESFGRKNLDLLTELAVREVQIFFLEKELEQLRGQG